MTLAVRLNPDYYKLTNTYSSERDETFSRECPSEWDCRVAVATRNEIYGLISVIGQNVVLINRTLSAALYRRA